MLIFLVLCTFLQTLHSASLPPPHANSSFATVDTVTHLTREAPVAPNDGGAQFRTVYAIVQSCLATILSCVWKSAHPNINGPWDSGWTRLKRKMVIMLCTMVTPELVLYWALEQRSCAQNIAQKYNQKFPKAEESTPSPWRTIVGWFQPLPKVTAWRGDGQQWTTTHGFFIQMGGFMLYKDGYPKQVLDYDRFANLLREEAIDAPTVTERELQDRSKGDVVSKAIIMLQTTWFVAQCILRAALRLPLSELEVVTLAFAVMNVAIYVAWWNKPQGVDVAICVPLKGKKKEVGIPTTSTTGEVLQKWTNPSEQPWLREAEQHEASMMPSVIEEPNARESLLHLDPQANSQYSNDPLHPHTPEQHPDEYLNEKGSWLRHTLQMDFQNYSFPFFLLLRVPFRIFTFVLRTFGKLFNPNFFERGTPLRVPMFYLGDQGKTDHWENGAVMFVIGTIFGAVHLFAWTSQFPSPHGLILWRVSAIVLAVMPITMVLMMILLAGMLSNPDKTLNVLMSFLLTSYIVARFIVIIVALLAIHHPPHDVLRDVIWTSYVPHV